MNIKQKIQIYELHKVLHWPFREIGPKYGISPQRAQQIVSDVERGGILEEMELKNNHRLNGQPISATQLARETGIPYCVIKKWVQRGRVKVLQHPGHVCTGNPVLLDPVTLQERIDQYRPRSRRTRVSA